MEALLADVSKLAGAALGELRLALVGRRGVTRARLHEWACQLRDAADRLDAAARINK